MGLINEAGHRRPSVYPIIASIGVSLVVVAGLCAGYLFIRHRHAQQRVAIEAEIQQAQNQAVKTPVLTIAENDAQFKSGQIVLSGTVRNTGPADLSELTLEFELTRRNNAEKENKTVPLNKDLLKPEDEGQYLLALPANVYRLAKVTRVFSRSAPENELIFNRIQGLRRPKQAPPADFADAQQKKNNRAKGNDEFLNSPDKPISLP